MSEELSMSQKLWTDLKTDAERSAWLLMGRGYETGVVAPALQNELAMAFHRLSLLSTATPAGVTATEPVQYLRNVCADVLLALRNCDREPLALLLEQALRGFDNPPATSPAAGQDDARDAAASVPVEAQLQYWKRAHADLAIKLPLVRDAALEEAAKICEAKVANASDWDSSYWDQAVEQCAAAIRALKSKPAMSTAPASEPVRESEPNPLALAAYAMSESYHSGYRLILGFDTLAKVQAAHEFVAALYRKPSEQGAKHDPMCLNSCPVCDRTGTAPTKAEPELPIIKAVQEYLVGVVRSFGDVSCAAYISTWHKPEQIAAALAKQSKEGGV